MLIQNDSKEFLFSCLYHHIQFVGHLSDHPLCKQPVKKLQSSKCQEVFHKKQNLNYIVLKSIENHLDLNQL